MRRVSQKEQKEAKEEYSKKKNYKSILKSILKEKTEKIIEEILKTDNLSDFLERAKENQKELEKLVGRENTNKIIEILKSQKTKKLILKKEICFHTTDSNGLEKIKKIFEKIKDAEVKYISAGKYSIKIESNDLKKADNKLKNIVEEVAKTLKENTLILD